MAAGPLSAEPDEALIRLRVDGTDVEAADGGASLLSLLRDQLGIHSAKDGCSPQGQCGCCTVWVDGAPRVACVTPVRRLEGREVTTLEGLPSVERDRWVDSFVATGGSQCGFCTPGIVMRLAALTPEVDDEGIDRALLAHLCRCTGWQTIREAAHHALARAPAADDAGARDFTAAAVRATLEGGAHQEVGPRVVGGSAGFAEDTAPPGALVAVPDGAGGYVVADSLEEARARSGKVQGRRTGSPLVHPVPLPAGEWDLTLQTTWVEPAYLETDASWCIPGGQPASPYANGGAFGGKLASPVADDARRLADRHGRPVRVVWSREDVVRSGPKRPPVASGVRADGSGVLCVGVPEGAVDPERWREVTRSVAAVAPRVTVEAVPLSGPPLSFDLRAAVWAEAAVVSSCAPFAGRARAGEEPATCEVVGPGGGRAVARCLSDGSVEVEVDAGPPLDEVVLRSYCIGAAHQALGWVRSEGVAVVGGAVQDLTIRSFGILASRDMPPVSVTVRRGGGDQAVNGSDAVFAAVAGARWLADGLPSRWPTARGGRP